MSVRDIIARALYPYGAVRTILRGSLRGYKYIVGPSMGASFAFGSNAHNYSFLARKVSAGSAIFDVGANQGQLSLFFANAVGEGGSVISFEPIEELADRIRQNANLNQMTNVQVIAAAAAGSEGIAEFRYTAEHSTQGMLQDTEPTYEVPGAESVEVRTVTLDSTAEDLGLWPDLIKVDVEGGAGAVFEGAKRVLNLGPDIYIEQHGPEEQRVVKDEIISRGYTARTLDGKIVEDPTNGWHNPLWCTRA